MKSITYTVLAIGALGTLGVMAYAGQSLESLVSGFTLWALAPFATFAAACALARSRAVAIGVLVAAVVATLFAAFVYIDAFFIHIHSTSALVFIFIPLYQLVAAVILLVAAFVSRRAHVTSTI
jgi:hypothetical protein